jgi:thymidylate synthase
MRSIAATNVNDAYQLGMQLMLEHGRMQPSQHGNTLEVPGPVSVSYALPQERVLFDAKRDSNPFLNFFEPLWILAGRDDVEFLEFLVPNMAKYSDNGTTYHGAYGMRIRGQDMFHDDQIVEAITRLQQNHDDRQIVVTIRDRNDLWYRGKDTPCFAGNTLLPSPEGDYSFAEVAAKFMSGKVGRWPVYAVDPNSGEMKIQWATNVWNSGRKKTVKITFDTGLVLRITPEHILYKKTTGKNDAPGASKYSNKLFVNPVQAGTLKKGDRVLATSLGFKTDKGHMWIKKNIYKNTAFNNMQKVHRAYYELEYGEIESKHDIHHINEDKLNNSLYNLDKLSTGEHSSIHRRGDDNPMRNMSAEQHASRSAKLKQTWADKRDVVNHVVVSMEEGLEEDVYDFTVPEYHNALIGDGLVAHNCNLMAAFKVRQGKLNMQVFNRSNDFVWGMTGTNVCQFSFLQEYMANKIGVDLGVYHQTTDSFHVYDNEQWQKLSKHGAQLPDDPYSDMRQVKPFPLGAAHPEWDNDLKEFFFRFDTSTESRHYQTDFFADVVEPMWRTFNNHKRWRADKTNANIDATTLSCSDIVAEDWHLATQQWLERRWSK